jgi:predicted permease
MQIIFESLLPVFLLIILGVILKRSPVVSRDFWSDFERFGFYILFPALVFVYLVKADFSQITLDGPPLALTIAILCQLLIMWIIQKPIKAVFSLNDASFSSFYQTSTRFNGFILIPIVESAYGNDGAALAILVLACFMLPINIFNVAAVVKLCAREDEHPNFAFYVKRITANPLVIACVLGLIVQLVHIPIYAPILVSFDLLARAALGLGLIMVGSGLRLRDVAVPTPTMFGATFFKLLFFPALIACICYLLQIDGIAFTILVLGAGMPTAMNGYLIARQYGGDAELYAAISVMQVVVSFFTISLIMYLVG